MCGWIISFKGGVVIFLFKVFEEFEKLFPKKFLERIPRILKSCQVPAEYQR